MADEVDPFEPIFTFFFAWFGLTLAVFPLIATIDTAAFGGTLGSFVVIVASTVVTIPAALEFVFSDRNPRLVATFVVVFVALYFVAIVAQSTAYVALGRDEPVPAIEVAVLFATYAAAYGLVYRDGLDRFRRTLAR